MTDIPLIDIAPLFAGEASPALDRALAGAFSECAAVLVGGFPGAGELEDTARRLHGFFDLPETVKRAAAVHKYEPGNRNLYRGYTPLPTADHWAYNEIFDMGPEPPLPAPDLPSTRAFEEANAWPDEAAIPGWRRAMEDYAAMCRSITALVLPAALRGLGKPGDAAAHLLAGRNGVLRLLNYPVVPDWFSFTGDTHTHDADGRRLITSDHIDTGVLSVLWQDDQAGLQMQGRDGIWRDVPKQPGVLSVHCGDLLEPIGGAALAGTHHRVFGGGAQRGSIGYFGEPDFTTLVDAPDGSGRKTYGRYLTDQFPARFLAPA